MHELKKEGYEVSRGYFKLYTPDDCPDSYVTMETCYGSNPAAPYVAPVVPNRPDEFVDPATDLAFGPTAEGYHINYRLDRSEIELVP